MKQSKTIFGSSYGEAHRGLVGATLAVALGWGGWVFSTQGPIMEFKN